MKLYICAIAIAFLLPTVLYWRRVFFGFSILIGSLLCIGWVSVSGLSSGDLNAGGSLGVAALFVISVAFGLGILLRILLYPIASDIALAFAGEYDKTNHRGRVLGVLRSAGAGFIFGTFGWLVAAQMSVLSVSWLAIAISSMLGTVTLFATIKAIASVTSSQRTHHES